MFDLFNNETSMNRITMGNVEGKMMLTNWTNSNSAGLKLNRREMLAGTVCVSLGLGNKGECSIETQSKLSKMLPGFEEYERMLSKTDQLETLGIPPSWSLVREGFHPLTPDRVVILEPDAVNWRSDHGSKVFDRVNERMLNHPSWKDRLLAEEKLRLIVRFVEILTRRYCIAERMEDWAFRLARREALGSTALGGNAAIPHQFQLDGTVTLDNTSVDWWLFLFPEGVEWDGLDRQPVHAMLSHVFPDRWTQRNEFSTSVFANTWRAIWNVTTNSSWKSISRMNQVGAARFVNRRIV